MAKTVTKGSAPACLIDASIYIFRYYFSLPDNWFSPSGYSTAAVYGYTTFLLQLLQQLLQHDRPVTIVACFDESLGSCFRNDIYPDYKASRALPDEALAFQLAACREVTELLGIATFASETYEADDLIGTWARKLRRRKTPIAIVSRDKDLGQLLHREQDYLWDYAQGVRYYPCDIVDKFGVRPDQLVDYLALVGDSVDDIPGVPGIGAKTGGQLLQHYGNVVNMFAHLDELPDLPIRGAKTLANKLIDYTEQIAIARQLAALVDDIPLEASVKDINWRGIDVSRLETFYRQMGFAAQLMNKTKRLCTS